MPLLLALLVFATLSHCQPSRHPRPLTWSSKSYGPDGPWQAVSLQYGTPAQSIDVYPGGAWESVFLSPDICLNEESKPVCRALEAGVYNPSNSSTAVNSGISGEDEDFHTVALHGDEALIFDTLTLPPPDLVPPFAMPNLSSIIATKAFRTLPNGQKYSAQVGNLALGAVSHNHSFDVGNYIFNGSLLTSYLFDHGLVPSSSYGLHIGSAALRIQGSLYIGGYDKLRVVGPVSVQAYSTASLPIELLDISIGVATGRSPFNFASKSGLLAEDNPTGTLPQSLIVEVDAKEPYLYLPQSTCQAISRNLPVTYSPELGLYLWNTADPLYTRIVSSPAYLAFTFRANNSLTMNLTINVPFRLLNLTLAQPLANKPTPYFPCSLPTLNGFRLGRAFLQAAFISVIWNMDFDWQGSWFLAQAPGPNLAHNPAIVDINPTDKMLVPSDNPWLDSWHGFWDVIADDGAQNAPDDGPASGPPLTGGNGGVIAGATTAAVVVVVAAGLLAAMLLFRRRKARKHAEAKSVVQSSGYAEKPSSRGVGLLEHMRRYQLQTPPELSHPDPAAYELPGCTPETNEPKELNGDRMY